MAVNEGGFLEAPMEAAPAAAFPEVEEMVVWQAEVDGGSREKDRNQGSQ